MFWLAALLGCGLLPGGGAFAVEEPTSGVEYSWPVQKDIPLFSTWQLTGSPQTCTLPAGAKAQVARKMRVIREPVRFKLPAKRVLLGNTYGAVSELDLRALNAGQALNYEVAAGTELVVYGDHPLGRGCLMRLPDSRVVSAACIPGAPSVKRIQHASEIRCEGLTGWIGEPD